MRPRIPWSRHPSEVFGFPLYVRFFSGSPCISAESCQGCFARRAGGAGTDGGRKSTLIKAVLATQSSRTSPSTRAAAGVPTSQELRSVRDAASAKGSSRFRGFLHPASRRARAADGHGERVRMCAVRASRAAEDGYSSALLRRRRSSRPGCARARWSTAGSARRTIICPCCSTVTSVAACCSDSKHTRVGARWSAPAAVNPRPRCAPAVPV